MQEVHDCKFSQITSEVQILWKEQNCVEIGKKHQLPALCKVCLMQFYQMHFASPGAVREYCSGNQTFLKFNYDSPVDNRDFFNSDLNLITSRYNVPNEWNTSTE